ncbi:MAG: SH3 domain-containing protein [Pyrinomonadaceae bacterium]
MKLFILILLAFSLNTFAQTAEVIKENTILRETPQNQGKSITELSKGDKINVVRQEAAWFYVDADGAEGWIHGNSIAFLEDLMPEKSASTSIKSKPVKKSQARTSTAPTKRKRGSSGARKYIVGKRGGCYYINSKRKKTYVSRSFCK